ncbi:MAG: hypothetical protein HY916_00245 [Desulfovibrio sp.]|jgi:hypothetical protein|nr:hypothetical protein [Desulfovibrio sp.]
MPDPSRLTATAHERPRSAPPAARIYDALRRARGFSHEEATRHLRRTLRRYFRAA